MALKRIIAADLFCGAGGTSTGLAKACESLGLRLDLTAVNHWPIAVETHAANHPTARHLCTDLDEVNPRKAIGRRLDLLMASPECTHHSIARGGTPVNDQSRSTAWHVIRWADALRPKAILVENVREFVQWGPIGVNGRPVKRLRGETFRAWVHALESLGYRVGYQILNAADYGDPTTRQRLFVLATLNRRALPWPQQTHAKSVDGGLFGTFRPWRPAREIIDWSLAGKSIFGRKKPLSANTLKRIEAGMRKFKWPEPFLVLLNGGGRQGAGGAGTVDQPCPVITASGGHIGLCQPFMVQAGGPHGKGRHPQDVDAPMRTVITENHTGIVEPFLMHITHTGGDRVKSIDDPLATVTGANRGELAFIIPSNYGEHPGQPPRTHTLDRPMPTVVAGGIAHALIEPFIVPQFSDSDARSVDRPVGALTTTSRGVGLCEPFVCSAGGPNVDARQVGDPLNTVLTRDHMGMVEPFLVPYYGTAEADSVGNPLRSVTTHDRLGMVEPAQLDIRFRMLQPHELAAAQGFPADYKFAGNRSEQVKQIGNAVPCNIAEALTRAILGGSAHG